MTESGAVILEELYRVIESRKGGDPSQSYTAELLAGGAEKAGQKLGEEAVETVIAALGEDKQALAQESADLLYHLLVLWAARGVTPDDVWRELGRRQGTSGHVEKAARTD